MFVLYFTGGKHKCLCFHWRPWMVRNNEVHSRVNLVTNLLVFCCWQKWLFTRQYFCRKSNIVKMPGIHFQSDQCWHKPRKLQYFCHLSIISIVLNHNQVFWLRQLWFFLYCGGYVCSIMTNVAHLCPCVYSDLWPDLVPASYCLTVRLLG